MALNRDKLSRRKEEVEAEQKGYRQTLKFKTPGQYLLFVCPPCDPNDGDGFPFVEVKIHYGLGESGRPAACLRTENHPLLLDERLTKHVKGAPGCFGDCPTCDVADDIDDKDQRKNVEAKSQYLFNLVLIGKRQKKGGAWEKVADPKVDISSVGTQIWEGITDVLLENPEIMDPQTAIFIVLTRKGTGRFDTEYKVELDRDSDKDPVTLPKALRSEIAKKVCLDGENDLYKYFAKEFVHSKSFVSKLLSGESEENDDDDDDDTIEDKTSKIGKKPKTAKPPVCFKMDYEDDSECAGCPFRGPCSEACDLELYPGHELKPGDMGYEEEKGEKPNPKKKPAAKPTSKKKPEPEEDEEDEEEEDLDDDDDDDDESEEEGEEENEVDQEKLINDTLVELGYDAGQINRMTNETALYLYENGLAAKAVSVGKDGGYTLFAHKLDSSHPMWKRKPREPKTPDAEQPKGTAEEEAPKKRGRPKKTPDAATTSDSAEPEAPKKRGRPKKAAAPPVEPDDDDDEEEKEEELPDEPDDEEGEEPELESAGESEYSLDDLEKALEAASKKTMARKKS